MSDSMIDTFKALLAQGMTHAEALREFDEEAWKVVLRDVMTTEGRSELFDLYCQALRCRRNEDDMNLAIELWMNGWKSEVPQGVTEVGSWYWRSPPKRKNSNGRKYWSTTQAFNAMKNAASSA